MEYHKTKYTLYIQKLLRHRSVKTTLRHIQQIAFPQNEEYICKVAKTVEKTKELIERWIPIRHQRRLHETIPQTEDLISSPVV